MLNKGQKYLVNTFHDFRQRPESDLAFILNTFTVDKKCIAAYGSAPTQRSSRSKSPSISTPQQGKAGPAHSNVKSMLIVFISTFTELCIMKLFNQNELHAINNILTPYGVFEKKWGENDLLNVLSVPVFMAIKMTPVLHPPYSPHLRRCDFFFRTPYGFKGRKFKTAVIQAKSRDALA
jgi:hypothetical protein